MDDHMNAPREPSRLLVCNCQRTMDIDGARLGKALSASGMLPVYSELCRTQIGVFEEALKSATAVHVACTQEAPLFREVAEEKGARDVALKCSNIRERAGWCSAKSAALPKMAALLAEAAYETKPAGVATLKSQGVCLVYGRGQGALDVAAELASRLSVTVLLTDPEDALPPGIVSVPIYKGRIRKVSGHLGAFQIEVDGYAPMLPSSRGALEFVLARDGARSSCDLLFDMSGGAPLFADWDRRDGYVRVDPNQPAAVARGMFKIVDMVGEFEKPLYVSYDNAICAHARSQKVGCSNCLDACPTGAISPSDDYVAIDAAICGGCGSCSAVCPTGAVSYAYPQRQDLIARLQVLLRTYSKAGGARPIILFHDDRHGAPLIGAMARLGRGLPPNVLPFSLYSVLQLGHEALASALAYGAEHVVVLAPPDRPAEHAPLQMQVALVRAFLDGLGYEGARLHVCVERDPDAVEKLLYGLPEVPASAGDFFSPHGSKRDIARMALAKLRAGAPRPADLIQLPRGSPYGRIRVDIGGCTLCLACVGSCPANALADNPDRPQLAFIEAACVQCGICAATCPEKVISLEPRYDFSAAAMSPVVIKAEEPFKCISCGKPFGTKSTIERILARLKGRHSMFQTDAQARLIQMCDTCRVVAVAEEGNDPFRLGERPRIRTTEDYLAAETEADDKASKPEDFLS
jgi:ferredoxin